MKINEACYGLVIYTRGYILAGAFSHKVLRRDVTWFLSKVDKYSLGVSTLGALGGQPNVLWTCNSHWKYNSSSSPRVPSFKSLGLVVPEQVRQGLNGAESNKSPRRRAMISKLMVVHHLNVRTLLAKYHCHTISGSRANEILNFGRF